MKTLLLLLALNSLACRPSQLTTSAITLQLEGITGVMVDLSETDNGTCPILDANITATLNGVGTSFSDRGGGSCQKKTEPSVSWTPPSHPRSMLWNCNCRPAMLSLTSPTEAVEVKLCDGSDCAQASWPGATPLPTAELASPLRANAPIMVRFTPALPSTELYRLVSIGQGQGVLSRTELTWGEGTVTVPSHADNAQGVTVLLSRSETFEPTKCEGFGFCSPRHILEQARVELVP